MQQPNVPGAAIFVDVFHRPARGGGVYVLTHAHSDHMHGLCHNWRAGLLHCTPTTAQLLTSKFDISAVLRIHCLEAPFAIEDPGNPRLQITGTFVDADRCPGAAMLVLEGLVGGPVVHTGDFRFSPALFDSPALQHVSRQDTRLFLDASCAHPALADFPTKSDSIGMLLDILDRHAADYILLHSHQLGDEEWLVSVANRFVGEKLWFAADAKDRFQQLKLTHPSFCKSSCRLLAQNHADTPRIIIIKNSSARLTDPRLRDMGGCIEINCSMLWWAKRGVQFQDWRPIFINGVWRVFWSQHASLDELRRFVHWLAPSCIKPVCPVLIEGVDPKYLFSDLLSHDEPEQFRVLEQPEGCPARLPDVDVRTLSTAAETRAFFSRQIMLDDTLARFINDDSQWGDYMPAVPESIGSGSGQGHVDDKLNVDDLSPRMDTASAESQTRGESSAARRTLRGVPSAASVATTVLDTSEDDVELPVKRMRSQAPEPESVQSAPAEFIDLSPL